MKISRKRIVVNLVSLALAGAIWALGNVERTIDSVPSPDRKLTVHMTANMGWRVMMLNRQFRTYLVDGKTGTRRLVSQQAGSCYYNQVAPNKIIWAKNSRNFTVKWAVAYMGFHSQKFRVFRAPLQVQAGEPCCGSL